MYVALNVSKYKCAKVTSKYPVWYSSELKVLIKNKKIFHWDWKQNHNPAVKREFEKRMTRCIKLYINKVKYQIKCNSKGFLDTHRSIKRVKKIVSPQCF